MRHQLFVDNLMQMTAPPRGLLAAGFQRDFTSATKPSQPDQESNFAIDESPAAALAARSGMKIRTTANQDLPGTDHDAEEAEEKKKSYESAVSYARGLRIAGMNISFQNVINHLSSAIQSDQQALESKSYLVDLNEDALLRDEKGNVVETVEEKRVWEDRNKACSALYSADETTIIEGTRRVATESIMNGMRLESRMEEDRKTLEDLQSGKKTVDELTESQKKRIAKMEEDRLNPEIKVDGPRLEAEQQIKPEEPGANQPEIDAMRHRILSTMPASPGIGSP